MAEFKLPKNSRMGEGKVWPKPEGATNTREYASTAGPRMMDAIHASTPTMLMRTTVAQWFWTRSSTSRTRSTQH